MSWKTSKKIEGLQVTGSYNYYVDIAITGVSPYQSCVFTANAFTKPDKKIAIAVKCKWSRVRGVRSYHLMGLHSNTYQISAQDIGSIIQVEITPEEDEYKGVATAKLGPITLDPSLRGNLESILTAGGSKFPVQFLNEETDEVQKYSGSLLLTNDFIAVSYDQENKEARSVKFKYNLDRPFLEMNNIDTTKMALVFKGEEEEYAKVLAFMEKKPAQGKSLRISLKLNSKNARDLFTLAFKCFAAKNYLLGAKIISNIESIFTDGKLFVEKQTKQGKFTPGDLLLELDSMKKELYHLIQVNKELSSEKENLIEEVKRLEQDLAETIETYSKLLNDFKNPSNNVQDSFILDVSVLGKKEDIEARRKVKELVQENKSLKEKVEHLSEELDLLRNIGKNDGYFSESRIWNRSDEINSYLQISGEKKYDGKSFLKFKGKSLEEAFTMVTELEKELNATKKSNDLLQSQFSNLESQLTEMKKNEGSGKSSSITGFKMLETRLSETKRVSDILSAENKSLKKQNEELREEVDKARSDALTASMKNMNQIYDKSSEKNLKSIENILTESKRVVDEERDNVKRLESEKILLQRDLDAVRSKCFSLENEIQDHRSKSITSLSKSTNNIDPLERVRRLELDKSNLQEEISGLRSRLTQAEGDLKLIKSRNETLEMELNYLKKENDGYKQQINTKIFGGFKDEHMEKIKGLELQLGEANHSKEVVRIELSSCQARMETIKTENERLRRELSQLRDDNDTLQLKISNLSLTQTSGFAGNTTSVEMELKNYEFRKENDRLKADVELLKQDSMRKGAELDQVRIKSEALKKEFDNLQFKNMDLKRENEDIKLKLETNRTTRERTEHVKKAGANFIQENSDFLKISEMKNQIELMAIEINQLRIENETLRKEVESLRDQEHIGNISFKDGNSIFLNKTMQFELETENENLKKNIASMELAVMEYKSKFEQAQREIAQLQTFSNRDLSFRKSNFISGAFSVGVDEQSSKLAEERLAEVNRNLDRVSRENAELRAESERLKSRMNNSVTERRNDNNSNKIFELESELAMFKIEMKQLRDENATLKKELETLRSSNLNSSFRDGGNSFVLNRSFQVELESENDSLRRNIITMETALAEYRARFESQQKEIINLQNQIRDLKRNAPDEAMMKMLEEKANETRKINEKQTLELSQLKFEASNLNKEVERLRFLTQQQSALKNKLEEISGENKMLNIELAQLRAEKSNLLRELEMLKANTDVLNRSKDLQNSSFMGRTQAFEIENENESLRRNISNMEDVITEYRSRFEVQQREILSLQNQLKEIQFRKPLGYVEEVSYIQLESKFRDTKLISEKMVKENAQLKLELDNAKTSVEEMSIAKEKSSLVFQKLNEALAEKEFLKIELNQIKVENETLKKEIDMIRNNNETLNRSIRAFGDGSMSILNRSGMNFELESENEALRRSVATMETAITEYRTRFELSQKEVYSVQAQMKELQLKKPVGYVQEIAFKQIETKYHETKKLHDKQVIQISDLKIANDKLVRDMDRSKREVQFLKDKHAMESTNLSEENRMIKREIEILRSNTDIRNASMRDATLNMSGVMNKSLNFELENENESLRKNISNMEEALSDYRIRQDSLQKQVIQLNNQIKEYQTGKPPGFVEEIEYLQLESKYKECVKFNEALMETKSRLIEENEALKRDQERIAKDSAVGKEILLIEVNQLKSENDSLRRELEMVRNNSEILNRSMRDHNNSSIWTNNRSQNFELENENEDLRKNVNTMEQALNDYRRKIEFLQIQLDEKKKGGDLNSSQEFFTNKDRIYLENEDLREENRELKTENERLKHCPNPDLNKSNLSNSKALKTSMQFELEAENELLRKSIASMEQALGETRAKHEIVQREIASLSVQNADLTKENEILKGRLRELANNLEIIKHEVNQVKSENESLRNENELLRISGSVLNKSRNDLNSSGFLNRSGQLELENENETLRRNLDAMENMLQEHRSKFEQAQREAHNLQIKLKDQQSQILEGYVELSTHQKLLDKIKQNEKDKEKLIIEISQLRLENENMQKELEYMRSNAHNNSHAKSARDGNSSSILNRSLNIELENENEMLRESISSLENMLSEYRGRVETFQRENLKLKDQIREVETKQSEKYVLLISELNVENDSLKKQIDVLKVGTEKVNTSGFLNKTSFLELESENESLRANISSLENMMNEYKRRYEESQKSSLQAEGLIMDLRSQVENNVDTKKVNNDLKNELEILRKTLNERQLNKSSASLRNSYIDYELENENLRKNLSSLEDILRDLRGKNALLTQEVAQLELTKRKLEEKVNEFASKNEELKYELMELRATNDTLRQQSSGRKADRSLNSSSILNKSLQIELENENEVLRSNVSSLEQMLGDYRIRLEIYQKEIASLQSNLKEAGGGVSADDSLRNSKNMRIELENNDLRVRNDYLVKEIDRLTKEIDQLKRAPKEVNNEDSFNNSLWGESSHASESKKAVQQEQEIELLKREKELLKRELESSRFLALANNNQDNQKKIDQLLLTNQKFMQENLRLQDQVNKLQEDLEAGSRSRILDDLSLSLNVSSSRIDVESENKMLREKIKRLQRENDAINNEKDKLLVELSKLMS